MTPALPNQLVRHLVRATAALALLGVVVGLPVALVIFVGWPLPPALPTAEQLGGWLTSPLSDNVIVDGLAVAAWMLWAAFLPAVISEARAARRGLPTPATTGTSRNPLRIGAAALVTALALGGLPGIGAVVAIPRPTVGEAPAPLAGQPSLVGPSLGTRLVSQRTQALPGPATVHVSGRRYSYTVRAGDSLSRISAAWLGDPDRWPEICRANWHRHWAGVGGTLTDCNLIFPGWDLRLPDDATPPADARPATPPTPATERHPATPPHGNTTPDHEPAAPTATAPTAQATEPRTPLTAPDRASTPTPSARSLATVPSASPSPHQPTGPDHQEPGKKAAAAPATSGRDRTDEQGIHLPGSFLPWSLASAIAAAVALVWLQRRRRHTPASTGDDPTDLPPAILRIHEQVAAHPTLPRQPDLAQRAATVGEPPRVPPGGLGLTGPGAHAAARALLVSVLASGGPRDPDQQGEVVIDGATLTTLIGADAAALGSWPRLHVADNLDHALRLLDARLLHRARLLDEHTVTDLGALRNDAPEEQPLPPILLISDSPPAGTRMRTHAVLAVGADLDISAVLLGQWPHGTTLDVGADGHLGDADEEGAPGPGSTGDRMALLDPDTAVAVLATLREAHTGHRPAIALPSRQPADPARPRCDAQDTEPTMTSPTATAANATAAAERLSARGFAEMARLRVFGPPQVDNVTAPGKPLRSKAAELAVFLACHRDGADTRTLRDHLEPGVRIRSADTRVHTNVSNLRHVLARAGGPRKSAYVTHSEGRYRLDPTSVDVDLWRFRDQLTRAQTAGPKDRVDLLRRACQSYTGPLAADCDYIWIEAHRERVRQEAADAHLLLATALLDAGNPLEAAQILDKAIAVDPYNEALYQAAMHARHALGDRQGIRNLLQALNIALADLDAEPEDATRELADRLARTIPAPRPDGSGPGKAPSFP